MKKEAALWQNVKKNTPNITWTRVESWASFGFPDLVGYTEKQGFFTVELKLINNNRVKLSPHQYAFHMKHITNTWILCNQPKVPGPRTTKPFELILVPGACALKLATSTPAACGLWLESWSELEPSLLKKHQH
jgi:hypothetical protein|tara:strand:- start:57 stop:455 length:399 start_codon:yes stop_codon:yes gene_type:complete